MSKAEYKRLGDYIREVNVRNRELKVTNLLGVSISKEFMPSIANTIGTDMSTYKIVERGQFAYGPVTSRNGDKVSIALLDGYDDAIISQAYTVFEVIDHEQLWPEYLMMWFRRPEFDRYARFHSHGSAREIFDWDELCDVMLPVPSITRQREIVSEYETLSNRIRLNNQMIQHLEATAQTLYRKTFVDNIDKENLPEGWRMGTFTEIARLSGGGTPDTNNDEYWGGEIPFFTPADSTKIYCIKTDKMLTELGFDNCSSKMYKKNTTFVTARGTVGEVSLAGCNMAMNQSCYALLPQKCNAPLFIHRFAINTVNKLKEEAVGAVFNALVTKDFETTEVIVPPTKKMIEYNSYVESVYEMVLIIQQENEKLTELQSLLLAKMGQ
ncbi:MAG: restriction endonuclease subunit S [Prevotella sp.]|nr:restriction endonuclease subunit S [Prevotella sp.]